MSMDSQPLKLRADDLPDDVPAQMIALADTMRSLNAEATHLLSIVTRPHADMGRTFSRVQNDAVQIHEMIGRVQDSLEVLTRTLRASGRL